MELSCDRRFNNRVLSSGQEAFMCGAVPRDVQCELRNNRRENVAITENEAFGKWCPMVRLLGFKDSQAEGCAWNRAPSDHEPPHSASCIGSRCMMWQWHESTTFKHEANAEFAKTGKRLTPIEGFCGLAAAR